MVRKGTILNSLPYVLKKTKFDFLGKRHQGKVRDFYFFADKRILITTDRQSAFDVILGYIPFKGAVLNLLSAFWFKKTKHIVDNHMLTVPDPNVMVVKNCQPIPIEMVVRGYLSGVTKTSIWTAYKKRERTIYGIKFPDGLKKNQKLPQPIITPTTHPPPGAKVHDEKLTKEQILKRKIIPEKLYLKMEEIALKLFDFGSLWCQKRGLILVDTKYEFGLYQENLTLIDEIHTPDSSRFWTKESYDKLFSTDKNCEVPSQHSSDARMQTSERGKSGSGEPENFDKEFLRLWYVKRGYRGDGVPPKMTKELVVAVAQRYIAVYEKITGKKFRAFSYPIDKRIKKNLLAFFKL